jgi:hypothetical protein
VTTRVSDVIGTKTEEQAHADWLKKAETPAEAEKMASKIAEYESLRRPIRMSDIA